MRVGLTLEGFRTIKNIRLLYFNLINYFKINIQLLLGRANMTPAGYTRPSHTPGMTESSERISVGLQVSS